MTLVHLITRLSLGGSARNTMDSAAAAARAGYRTLLVTGPSCEEQDVGDEACRLGCEVRLLPSLRRSVSPFRDLAAVLRVARLLRRERVQILHTHTSKAGFIGRLAAFIVRVPVVIHTPHGHIFYAYYGTFRTALFVLLERLGARLCDRIVTLTMRGTEEHLARGIGRAHKYVSIPSGVDVAGLRRRASGKTDARRALGWDSSEKVVVGVGRLVPVKGFDVLVKALVQLRRSVPGARLVLVGDGPEQDHLAALARGLGVDGGLSLMGARDDVTSFLCAADVLASPSRNEGMGRVLVEAMALGTPVVATRVGGVPSVIEDGSSGILVPTEDPPALAEAIRRTLTDSDLAASLAAAGRTRAEAFSLPVMEAKLLELYRALTVEKGLAAPVPGKASTRVMKGAPPSPARQP